MVAGLALLMTADRLARLATDHLIQSQYRWMFRVAGAVVSLTGLAMVVSSFR
jgi:cytochrome c biogenesis protein CcdA